MQEAPGVAGAAGAVGTGSQAPGRRARAARGLHGAVPLTLHRGPLHCDRPCRVTAPGQEPPNSSHHHGNRSRATPPRASWHHWPLTGRWPMAVCPCARRTRAVGSAWSACRDLIRLGTGPLPDATGAERKEGQGATGTLQALHGPAAPVESDGRDGGPRRSPHSPRGRAGPGAHVLRPPREPCGLVGQSWGQPRAPPGERGGGPCPAFFPKEGALGRPPTLRSPQNPTQCPASQPEHPPLPCPRSLGSGQWLSPRTRSQEAKLRLLAKPPPGTWQPGAFFGKQTP